MAAAARERRCRALNHLAFHVESTQLVDTLCEEATQYGWRLLLSDRHPYAGGPNHYAACLEDIDGFEVELVAIPPELGY